MLKEMVLPRFLTFWVLAGFLVFWAVWRTNPTDIVTDSKLIMTGALLVYVLAYAALERQFAFERLRRDRGLLALLLLGLTYLVWITLTNTVWSSDPSFTLLGWQGWHGGYLLYAMCTLLLLSGLMMRRVEVTQGAVTLAFGMVTLSAVLSALEYLGFDVLSSSPLFESLLSMRVNQPLSIFPLLFAGNSGFISAMWLLMVPFPLLVWRERPRLAALFVLMLGLGVSASHGKASVLLFAAVCLAGLVLAALRRRWKWTAVLAVSLVLSSTGPVVYPPLQRALYQAGLVKRQRSFEFAVGDSLSGRLVLWSGALKLWRQRPLTGWGLETLPTHFFDVLTQAQLDTYGVTYLQLKPGEKTRQFSYMITAVPISNPSQLRRSSRVLVVKAHDVFVDELYGNGLVGLLLSLSLTLGCAAYVWRSGATVPRLLLVGVALYAAYLLVWFVTLSVTPLAAMLLGVSVALAAEARAGRRAGAAGGQLAEETFAPLPGRLPVAGTLQGE